MRSSRLPMVKQLHDFDFTFQPSLRREQIDELGFVERRENVICLGPPGVGKTHLAISLAIAAAQSGRRVYYGTLAALITSLEEAQAAGRLQARLKVLTHPAVLVVDEIGYLPITPTGAMLFFQLMTRRYDHASTVLISNKGFEERATSLAMTSWRRCSWIASSITATSSRSAATATGCGNTASCGRRCTPRTSRSPAAAAAVAGLGPSGGHTDDDLRLVPSSICQIFTRRNCQIFNRC